MLLGLGSAGAIDAAARSISDIGFASGDAAAAVSAVAQQQEEEQERQRQQQQRPAKMGRRRQAAPTAASTAAATSTTAATGCRHLRLPSRRDRDGDRAAAEDFRSARRSSAPAPSPAMMPSPASGLAERAPAMEAVHVHLNCLLLTSARTRPSLRRESSCPRAEAQRRATAMRPRSGADGSLGCSASLPALGGLSFVRWFAARRLTIPRAEPVGGRGRRLR